jgi:DNA-binding CsgD family transcriptional regulator
LTYSLRNNFGETKRPEYELILDQMSARERQFLKWVCHEDEYTYDQIASLMEVTARTVDGYRESLFDKFAIKSKTGLVLFVLKHKLFDLL